MTPDNCRSCGRAVWRYEEFCSGCGIGPDSPDELGDLFVEASRAPKTKCPRCGWKCRCVSVLFLYNRADNVA
jgi:hypothetical protein